MGLNKTSDYGSGSSSMNSSTSWGSQELVWQTGKRTKAASYADLANGRCTIEDVMQEFRMNGSDAPYNPDEEQPWLRRDEFSSGVSPANAYMRQKSWPAPERTPSQRLTRPVSASYPLPAAHHQMDPVPEAAAAGCGEELTWEQRRVLSSLSDIAVLTLLRDMQRRNKKQPTECRFCKNNGERESYYRSHTLKDAEGLVACPVLRAFVCKRCGASGDTAHTIKYCPYSTCEERMKSAAMMRSVRLASGRRRTPSGGASDNYVVFGSTPAAVLHDRAQVLPPLLPAHPAHLTPLPPLPPLWQALEQKLML